MTKIVGNGHNYSSRTVFLEERQSDSIVPDVKNNMFYERKKMNPGSRCHVFLINFLSL